MLKESTAKSRITYKIMESFYSQTHHFPIALKLLLYGLLGFGVAGSVINSECYLGGVAFVAALGGGLAGAAGLIGVIAGYLLLFGFEDTVLLISAALFTYTISFLFQYTVLQNTRWFMPIIVFAVISLIRAYGAIDITRDSITYVPNWCIEAFFGAALTYLYHFSFQADRSSRGALIRIFSWISLLSTVMMQFSSITLVFEISPANIIFQTILMLTGCHSRIHIYPIALMLGLALEFGQLSREGTIALYLVYALYELFGFYKEKHKIIFYMMIVSICAIPISDVSKQSISQLIECAVASLIFLPINLNFSTVITSKEADPYSLLSEKITRLSLLLNRIAKDVRSCEEHTPEITESNIHHILDCAVEQVCFGCPKQSLCWEKHHMDSYNVFHHLMETIHDYGKLSYEDFPVYFRQRCDRSHSLMVSINYELRRSICIEKAAAKEYNILSLGQQDYQLFSESLLKMLSHKSNEASENPRNMPIYSAEIGIASKRKKGEEVCGDTAQYFKTTEGMLYVALSDGIGCGKYAKAQSSYIISLLEECLQMFNDPSFAISLLHNALCHKQGSALGYATVDLLAINLNNGNCAFYKAGAADSFIITNGILSEIEGNASLIGNLHESFHVVPQTKTLSDHSIIVMGSDGAELNYEKLKDDTALLQRKDMKNTAKRLLLTSKEESADDKTVITIRLQLRRNTV